VTKAKLTAYLVLGMLWTFGFVMAVLNGAHLVFVAVYIIGIVYCFYQFFTIVERELLRKN
jgi:hypothetical protein